MFRLLEILSLIYAGSALFLFVCYHVLRIRKLKDDPCTGYAKNVD